MDFLWGRGRQNGKLSMEAEIPLRYFLLFINLVLKSFFSMNIQDFMNIVDSTYVSNTPTYVS